MVQIVYPCWEAMPASSSPSSFFSWSAPTPTPTPTPMTTSTSMTETVIGSHLFDISGYSHSKGMAIGKYVKSDTFNAGGHSWVIYFYPNGTEGQDNPTYVSLFIVLASEGTDVRARFELKVLDQSGEESHMVRTQFDSELYTFKNRGCTWGYNHFFKRTALETPDYLKDDCLKVYCRVGVVISYTERPEIYSNVGRNLGHLFETGKGTDVNLKVDGETFADHSEGHSSGPSQRDNEGGSRSRGRRSSWRDNGGGSGSHGTKLSRQSTLTLSRQRAQGPSTPSNEDENNQLGQFLAEQNNQLGQFLAEQNNQLGQFLAKQRELLLGVFFFFLSLFLFFCLFVFLFLGK